MPEDSYTAYREHKIGKRKSEKGKGKTEKEKGKTENGLAAAAAAAVHGDRIRKAGHLLVYEI